jgi:Tol biopolymer transport system component
MAEHTAGALGSSIVRIHPDGSQRGEQVVADAINDCPAPSPDGARLAFRSNRSAAPPRPAVPTTSQTLWLLDPARKKTLTQLIIQGMSMVGEQTLAQQQLSCPSWSPDGKHLAAAVSIDQVNSLVVVSPGGTLERYIHLDFPTSPHAPLVWFSNNRTLLFAQPDNAGSGARIFQAWWNESFPSTLLLSLDGWDDVQGMSISPDGKQLALVLVHHKTAVRPADASLRVVNLADFSVAYQKEIYGYDPSALRGVGRIFWMQDKQVVFASPDGPLEHYKAMILRYDPGSDTLQTLAFVEDTLYDWALNGPWLVYSSESGLWGLPVIGRYDLPAAARRIAPDAPDEIAWK